MRFNSNGLTYTIFEVSNNDEKLLFKGSYRFGLCDHKKQEIYLMEDVNPEQKRRVLIHEVTHVFLNTNGMYAISKYNEEQLCEFVAYNSMEIVSIVDQYFQGGTK